MHKNCNKKQKLTNLEGKEYNFCMVKIAKKECHKIHFVGVGGVSMSALALLALNFGYAVSGVDDNNSSVLEKLRKRGVIVCLKSCHEVVENADLIVFTTAAHSHPDLEYAKKLKKPMLERAEFLAQISRRYKNIIAIGGTHGKTTTTAMLGYIFELAKLDPTVHIGGESLNWHGNLRIGAKEYFITEACEYNRSFLHLRPTVGCITNVECDHMDTYRDIDDLADAFGQFSSKSKKAVVYCGDSFELPRQKDKEYFSYGFGANNRFCARNLHSKNGAFTFDCYFDGKFCLRASLKILGRHNVLNALACIAICCVYRVPYIYIIEGIQNFEGVNRRQTFLGEKNGVTHVADYAHHPTEIQMALDVIECLPRAGKVVTVFQPHTYTRTKFLMREFVKVLSECKHLILLPTFAAREKFAPGGDSTDLFLNMPATADRCYCSNYYNLKFQLEQMLKPGDVCVWLGAGDIFEIANKFVGEC